MRNYALTYGAAVRQRTNRLETTMAQHGTMPEMIYQRQLQISANKVDLAASEGSVVDNEEEVEAIERNPKNDVEVAEYDSSTDEDEDLEEGDSSILELDRRSAFLDFLGGATTRFGRQVRINNRFLM